MRVGRDKQAHHMRAYEASSAGDEDGFLICHFVFCLLTKLKVFAEQINTKS
jgi:hypothetical protein